MNIFIDNKQILTELASVPEMNYGQMQRWKDAIPLNYSIEMTLELFIKSISAFFSEFREAEIEENDTYGFPELIAFKNAGWPNLDQLVKEHIDLLKVLIIYHEYEILHCITQTASIVHNYFYSINSVEEVVIENKTITLKGICFKVIRNNSINI